METKKSIAVHAFEKHMQELVAKLNGISRTISFEEFCKISNDVRTSFFKMEALCRVYGKTYGKPFLKWLKKCKLVEDLLGELDFYHNEILPQVTDKKDKSSIETKIRAIYKETFLTLKKDKWITGKRVQKMENTLTTLVFHKERKGIKKFIQKEIDKIISFHKKISYSNIEDEIHEMRRKLRWISIYAQSANGLIQLKKMKAVQNKIYKKYLTQDVLSSKFNVLPTSDELSQYIYFNQYAFYAISWIISELGQIKDEALLIIFKKEKSKKLKVLTKRAKEICTTFIEEDMVLQNLIVK